ncbi:MAG TPA: WD40 repeat domain-containing serine/threonine protein kinase [Chiayiivirga sp.]|nr:WD40 repeat domain-containing serine/threonine protein kinase [Chiayiivirga sp.]
MASSIQDPELSDPGLTLAPPPPRARTVHAALAELAFGSATEARFTDASAPLALLPADALELDLADPQQRQFGNYELLERIGQGGMGMVYRARQLDLQREVAIKLLAAGPWASRDFVDRFLGEARHAARMQHPNIVTVYEVGTAEDLHFFSMRLVRGRSLANALRAEGRFDPQRAAALMLPVVEAVAYAHSLNVLHLDLKPANILLDQAGTAHVADFGLARKFDPLMALGNTEISGTPSYMAPEQAVVGTQPLSPATDIWGLGAVLHDLVTGEPPYRGDSAISTLDLVRSEPVRSPRLYVPNLPLDLEAIILGCLRRDPQGRYASARALADDLARFLEGHPVLARPLPPLQRVGRWARREPKLAAALTLAIAALVIGFAATLHQWRRADANALTASINATQARTRLWQSRHEAAARFMQEGRGFTALTPLLDNIEEQEREGISDPHSTERREIGMVLSQGVSLIDRMVIPDADPLASALSHDGALLALAFNDFSVRWYDTATLEERGRVDVSDMPTSDGEPRLPRRLRFIDNQRLVVTLDWFDYLASPSHNDSFLLDLSHSRLIAFPPDFARPAEAVFSADGRHALLRNRDDQVQLWQVSPWQALGRAWPSPRSNVSAALLGRDGRYLAEKQTEDNGVLTLRDPRDGSSLRLTGIHAPLTAWMESADGRLLAVGDSRGNIYLVDVESGKTRQLHTPNGREVTWLAFSEDDTWLGAVRWDGAAFAFDVASGEPLNAGQMLNDFEPHEVAIDREERLLVVTGLGQTALWRLPEPGPNAPGATRLISSPSRAERAGTNALGIALRVRLLASADMSGEVRLWRIAPAAQLAAQAPSDGQMAGNVYFDGKHLPDVAWNKVRVVSIDGSPPTPWRSVPQPPNFAELTAQGRLLVVASGPALHVFDTDTMAQHIAPVSLPANPLYLTLDAKGELAYLGFGSNGLTGFEIQILSIDLDHGKQLATVTIPGPLRQFELSDDGQRLLAVGTSTAGTDVFSSRLERIGHVDHDPGWPVTWAAFVPGSEALWLMAREADDGFANAAELLLWNPRDGTVLERRQVPGVFPVGLTVTHGKPLLATRDQDLLDAGSKQVIATPRTNHVEPTAIFARSHDGRMIAHGFGRVVQIYDTATLDPIGPPLQLSAGTYALPYHLAFAPDDRTLLGGFRPWNIWPIAPDTRPVAELRALTQLLAPDEDGLQVIALPERAQRKRLRSRDPGAPPPVQARPSFVAARTVRGYPIPQRDPSATPMQLDLTAAYNRATDMRADINSSTMPGYVGMRLGLARIDGVEYDLRGVIELQRNREGFERVTGIQTPDVPLAAFHVLLFAPLAVPAQGIRDYALVRLHYADGSTADLPIRTQLEVSGLGVADRLVPVGWVRSDFLRLIGLSRMQWVNNPRLPNPHPEKRIVSLDLEATRDEWSNPVIFAITAEPVIAATFSSNDSHETVATLPTRPFSSRTAQTKGSR